jgi:gluconolactonase
MTVGRTLFSLLILVAFAAPGAAQILPAGAVATRLVTGYGFTEGPLYDRSGGGAGRVLFSDVNNSRIVGYNIATATAAIVDPASGAANGMFFDAGGHIVSADRDRRQISRRSTADLKIVEAILASQWGGMPLNSPNDLVIDAAGGIYFSDPDYDSRNSVPEAVYYINPAGALSRLLTGFSHPNGVILSPDGHTFYLAAEGQYRIFAFDVASDGTLSNQRLFARTDVDANGNMLPNINNGPDGLTIDPSGNIYAAVKNAVFAWNPAGARLFSLAVSQDPTNVELGGRNGKTLYITTGASLYSVSLNVVPKLPGDFEYDGDVDAADLAPWRTGFGQTGAALDADANADGAVNAADFLIWQQQLGSNSPSVPAGAAVPEPGAWLLAFMATAATTRRRRPRRIAPSAPGSARG